MAIERSGATLMRGGYAVWKRERKRREESERKRRATLEREVAQLRRAARERRDGAARKEREKRGAGDKGFIGHRAAKQMKRAIEIERRVDRRVDRRIEERSTLLRDWEKERTLAVMPTPGGVAAPLVVSNLVLSRERIEEAILASSATLLAVEHDRAFSDRVATEVIAVGRR